MTPATFQRVRELFAAVRGLPPAERAALLDRECGIGAGADNPIRAEVQSLLAQLDEPSPEFLEAPAIPFKFEATNQPAPQPTSGEMLGAYRLGRVLGEGGMGIVYEAEQEHPRRAVALKLIRPLFISPALLRRFEYEADVLARLEHPGIARIYEAGTFQTATGPQPFFAMELVRGRPLRTYVSEEKLSTQKRLELLRKICDAVQHAHQKSVIHRDLKPGNILVSDGGEPKILDFGVARAIDADVQSVTMNTQTGQLVGTLPYMSPEQVSGDVNGIDTRSDVYALGVIAYELLADRLPYAVLNKPVVEAARIIREDEPSRLSVISSSYRGDIETIVAKALEKDKERRYTSAGAIAADITHYLNYEPISARPPSAWYQVSRFAHRHKALVGGMIAVAIVLLLGMAATSWQAWRAWKAEGAMRAEKDVAQNAMATKGQVAEFMVSMFGAVDRGESPKAADSTVRQQLERAVRKLDSGEFKSQPMVESEVRTMIGDLYVELSKPDEAEMQLRRALEARRRAVPRLDDDPYTSIIQKRLLVALHQQGRIEEATELQLDVLARNRRLLGNNDPETIEALKSLAALLLMQRKVDEADPYVKEAIDRARAALPEDDPLRLNTFENLANAAYALGRYEEADRLWRELLTTYRKIHDEDHADVLRITGNVAGAQSRLRKPAEAEKILRDLLPRYRRKLGSDHLQTLDVELKLAIALAHQRRDEDAEVIMRDVLARYRATLGLDNPESLNAQMNLAIVLGRLQRLDEAETLLRDLIDRYEKTVGPADPSTVQARRDLAQLRAPRPASTSASKSRN